MLADGSPVIEIHWDPANPLFLMLVIGLLVIGVSILLSQTSISTPRYRPPRLEDGTPQRVTTPDTALLGSRSDTKVILRQLDSEGRSGADKRISVRRRGRPVQVVILDPDTGQELMQGWVLDRSKGGLGLLVPQPVSPEKLIHIRAVHAPDGVPAIALRVRHCRPRGRKWKVGGRFEQDLAWSVLLLFG